MIDDADFQRVVHALPFLRGADAQALREFRGRAFLARIPAGRDVFVEGDAADAIALLVSGVVRVFKIGESGREITLYRFGLGESCILTANAILSRQSFPAIATVEQDAEAVLVPADALRDWVGRFEVWRGFVFDLLSLRLVSLMQVVEEVAFRRLDARLAEFLVGRGGLGEPVLLTHQEIAFELGSSREVISRLLGDFAAQGWVALGRGRVDVLDVGALEGLALM